MISLQTPFRTVGIRPQGPSRFIDPKQLPEFERARYAELIRAAAENGGTVTPELEHFGAVNRVSGNQMRADIKLLIDLAADERRLSKWPEGDENQREAKRLEAEINAIDAKREKLGDELSKLLSRRWDAETRLLSFASLVGERSRLAGNIKQRRQHHGWLVGSGG